MMATLIPDTETVECDTAAEAGEFAAFAYETTGERQKIRPIGGGRYSVEPVHGDV